MDVAAWLRDLGLELERYEPAFCESKIDRDPLTELTEADPVTQGLPLGPRRKLLNASTTLCQGVPAARNADSKNWYTAFETVGGVSCTRA